VQLPREFNRDIKNASRPAARISWTPWSARSLTGLTDSMAEVEDASNCH